VYYNTCQGTPLLDTEPIKLNNESEDLNMTNAIIEAINARFNEDGVAKVTMKKNNTEVYISRYEDWGVLGDDDVMYEVNWGFNNSYGKFCNTLEEVADVLIHFEEVQAKQAQEKANLLDHIMKLQLMEEGTREATEDEISELRSYVSDWSKDFYHFRYRGHSHKREWF
jgi:hypothetical protein